MAESTTVTCDRCRCRIAAPRANRTRIRWAREPVRREPTDLCGDCAEAVLVGLGLAPAPADPMVPAA